jgi:GDP-L-fucose synthase
LITKNSKIYVAGHNGMVGSSIIRLLNKSEYKNIIITPREKLDLRNQSNVSNFFKRNRIDAVIVAAAKVGGIYANDVYRADFIYDNLTIQNNIIKSSFDNGIKDLIFLGSSCIYPKYAKQPIKEEYLLSGFLEKTNEPYAIAKIAGLKLCESFNIQYGTNYKCLMPCNLFGPKDNYNLNNSHFFPALISKVCSASHNQLDNITLWGNGNPKRELMYVDDLARACIHFLRKKTEQSLINVGSGIEMQIKQYAKLIMHELNLNLKIKYDKSKPNGTPRKVIDSSYANKEGWYPKFSLKSGIKLTIDDYKKNILKEKF